MEKTKVIRKTTIDYDKEGDVLYISFGGSQPADDSDVTDEGVIIRLKEGKIIGVTIPNAKKRLHI
ncbi:MAG TPA: DUF2283 domain-containing protein [Candidatus Hodarchaeales archaeon]|nr:DUF2283 domain-containing protein [Candidatus Hodarchaeales archaeon]